MTRNASGPFRMRYSHTSASSFGIDNSTFSDSYLAPRELVEGVDLLAEDHPLRGRRGVGSPGFSPHTGSAVSEPLTSFTATPTPLPSTESLSLAISGKASRQSSAS
jgi:hypothetical protein